MDNKLVISYTPQQIDEAIKEHIRNSTGYTGDFEITYTHKRTLKKVSAEITLSEPVLVSVRSEIPVGVTQGYVSDEDCTSLVDPKPEEDYVTGDTADLQGAAETVIGIDIGSEDGDFSATATATLIDGNLTFEDLPLHEQEEALGKNEKDEFFAQPLETILEQVQEVEDAFAEESDLDDMESLFS